MAAAPRGGGVGAVGADVSIDAWITLGVVGLLLAALIGTRISIELLFVSALTALLVAGVVPVGTALEGFANPAVLTIAALYVVVAGLRHTGGVQWIGQRILGKPASLTTAQARIMLPVTLLSAFLNNTPVVAMMIPAIRDFAQKFGFAPSRLLIPLSYAAILGGTCTLIGTSTNLVVHGLLLTEGQAGIGMFELAWVGLPTAALGIVFTLVFGRFLLPDRRSAMSRLENPREYAVEMLVDTGGPLAGKTIEAAGLRHLRQLYLLEIHRDDLVMPAVSPHETIRGGDRLVFVGVVDSVVDLQRIPGLHPATDQVFKLEGERSRRTLVEAVVSEAFPSLGRTIRESGFRNRYGAAIIAVARHGERIQGKVGNIRLRAGDTLLMEAPPSFLDLQRNSRDFYLVSRIENSHPLRFDRTLAAVGILAAMVLVVALGVLPMLEASLLAAGAMIVTGCTRWDEGRTSIDVSVLVVIAAALGIGHAIDASGLAGYLVGGLAQVAGSSPVASLAMLYVATALFSAIVTNNAAAALMFPVALGMSRELGVDILPFAIAIAMAASASFATPIGYQTNLMVYGPGGYRFKDFLVIGVPLTLLTGLLAVVIIPIVWSF